MFGWSFTLNCSCCTQPTVPVLGLLNCGKWLNSAAQRLGQGNLHYSIFKFAELRKHNGNRWAGFPQPVAPLGSTAAWVVWHVSEIIICITALKLILNWRLYRGFCQPKQKHLQSKWGPSGVYQKWKFPKLFKYTWNSWNCFVLCSWCFEVMLWKSNMFISFISFVQEFHQDHLISSLHLEICPFVNDISHSLNVSDVYHCNRVWN